MFSKQKQQGAVAIEFAAIFLLFFSLVYGTIAFGIPAVARMGFQHYSVEATRVAVKVDPAVAESIYLQRVGNEIDKFIAGSWLPEDWRNGCTDLAEEETWRTLPGTTYGYWRPEPNALPNERLRYQINVCIQASEPIVPQLVIGELRFPPYTDDTTGRSWVRGYTITTL
ncbi:pilus assembly protein [Halomonas sp. MC140]|nr:TadE/TadG family type IV pilus assembly protein [Halomonas sp. MC140]MDN7130808.1 pilus assembly protein [Halomonas sp. MC140]